jgi:hypothetical protein
MEEELERLRHKWKLFRHHHQLSRIEVCFAINKRISFISEVSLLVWRLHQKLKFKLSLIRAQTFLPSSSLIRNLMESVGAKRLYLVSPRKLLLLSRQSFAG